MTSVSKHQVDCVNDVNQVANSADFSVHSVQVVDVLWEVFLIELVLALVVNLLEMVSPVDEGHSNLTAGRFNSTIPLVTR